MSLPRESFDRRTHRAGAVAGWRENRRQTGAMPHIAGSGRRLFAVSMLLLVAVGGAVGIIELVRTARHGDVLPIRSVAVSGVEARQAEEIRAYANIPLGTPLFGVDLAGVADQVGEHPFVKSATVRRVPPDGIEIDVQTRVPKALVALDQLYLLDEDATLFKRAIPGDGLDLPVITGMHGDDDDDEDPDLLTRALAVIARYEQSPQVAGELAELNVHPGRGFTLVFQHGLRVAVGEGDLDKRLATLGIVLAELHTQGREAKFIYLSDAKHPERVALRLVAPAEMPGRSGT